jgi:hypothetical protein
LRKLGEGPVFLSQRGALAAAIVSIEEWDHMASELNRLRRTLEIDRQLAEIRAGNHVDFDDLDQELAVSLSHPTQLEYTFSRGYTNNSVFWPCGCAGGALWGVEGVQRGFPKRSWAAPGHS